MRIPASMDNLTKLITLVSFIIYLVVVGMQINQIIEEKQYILLLVIILLTVVFALSFYYSIKGYEVKEDKLIIKRRGKDLAFQRSEIEFVEKLEDSFFFKNIRKLGNGGFFGYYGKYHNLRIGTFNFYATKRKGLVLIRFKDGKQIVLSPDHPQTLIEAIQ